MKECEGEDSHNFSNKSSSSFSEIRVKDKFHMNKFLIHACINIV